MIKRVIAPRKINKFYILFYKKTPKGFYKRTTESSYDLELKRISLDKFIINLEKGIYEIPKYSTGVVVWKGIDFQQALPISGIIKFKRNHKKVILIK